MSDARVVQIGEVALGNDRPMAVVGGVNVLESRELVLEVAEHFAAVTERLGIPCVFKGSFDKANRSSIDSPRGPGLEQGLTMLQQVRADFGLPVLTDIHEPGQAPLAAEVCDALQLPAFLCRQTDLVLALAAAGVPVNLKKPQFLSAPEMRNVLGKFEAAGHSELLLCERGNCFGYNNLVVDMLNFGLLKRTGYPVLFDVTHSLQLPGGQGTAAGGRRGDLCDLARAGMSQGIAGLFIEVHPDPDSALCDGPCALRLEQLEPLLSRVMELDALVKSQPALDTA